MAWRIENTEGGKVIVLDGFEQGIAVSPYAGIANIKNANIVGVAGEASVALENKAMNIPPTVSAVEFTTTIATDTITVDDTTGYYNGMAITINSIVTTTGAVTGRVYWVGDLSGSTFKLYTSPSLTSGQLVDLTSGDGSGTLSSYTLGKPIDKATAYEAQSGINYIFILDDAGRVWWVNNYGGTLTDNLTYLGNDTLTGTTGRGIAIFKRHLIVFRTSTVDALLINSIDSSDVDISYPSGWSYGWESISPVSQERRASIVGQDDTLYYANSNRIASISENIGSSFDPSDSGTYTENVSALDIPSNDEVVSLAELGTWLLIGGVQNKIYPWDRISSSFNFPIIVPEDYIKYMVSTNSVAYIFAGFTGKIYVTNGSAVEEFKEIPDHLTEVNTPHFSIQDVEISQGQLYFSAVATENDGTSNEINSFDGVWAIDLTSNNFRCATTSTHNTNGTVHIILKNTLTNVPAGEGLYVGWEDSSGNYGIDTGSSNPYKDGETIIEFDAIPIGDFSFPVTPKEFEFKTTDSLVSGESVKIEYRTKIKGSYTTIDTFNTVGSISDKANTNFQNAQWLQIKTTLTSTHTSPSYVPLREVRIHI